MDFPALEPNATRRELRQQVTGSVMPSKHIQNLFFPLYGTKRSAKHGLRVLEGETACATTSPHARRGLRDLEEETLHLQVGGHRIGYLTQSQIPRQVSHMPGSVHRQQGSVDASSGRRHSGRGIVDSTEQAAIREVRSVVRGCPPSSSLMRSKPYLALEEKTPDSARGKRLHGSRHDTK